MQIRFLKLGKNALKRDEIEPENLAQIKDGIEKRAKEIGEEKIMERAIVYCNNIFYKTDGSLDHKLMDGIKEDFENMINEAREAEILNNQEVRNEEIEEETSEDESLRERFFQGWSSKEIERLYWVLFGEKPPQS